MEKIFNWISLLTGFVGGVFTFLFGGADTLLKVLISVVILDYITGVIKGIYTKTLSSQTGFNGLLKKILIFIVVVVSVIIQRLIDGAVPLREVTIMFFVCNECISLLENASQFIPIPAKIKEVLLQLSGKTDDDNREQLGGSLSMTFEAWVKKYKGKRTNYDGAYGVQCVDLIDCFIDRVLDIEKGFWGNAKYWWLSRNESKWLKANFDFVKPNYKNGELKKGDIGIRVSGSYGHIFVVAEPSKNGKFKYYDQNATGNGDPMTLREKAFTSDYITGVLRPKNQKNLKPTAPKIKNGTYTLTNVRGVYNGPGADTGRKKVKQLTLSGRLHATSKKPNNSAYLKAKTKVTIFETKLSKSGNLWAKIPSGYICIWEKDVDKKFVK